MSNCCVPGAIWGPGDTKKYSLPSWSSHSRERQTINKVNTFWNMVESSNCCRGKIKKRRGVESEERDIIFKEVRKGLTEKVTFEQRLKEVKK